MKLSIKEKIKVLFYRGAIKRMSDKDLLFNYRLCIQNINSSTFATFNKDIKRKYFVTQKLIFDEVNRRHLINGGK